MAEQRAGRMRPKYQQIADDLRSKIDAGEFQAGTRLPTKAALMEQYGVAVNTVERAIEVLRSMGLAETFQGVGTFVRQSRELTAGTAEGKRLAALEDRMARLEAKVMDLCANAGMPYELVSAENGAAEAG